MLVVFFICFYGGVFGQFIEPVFNFSKKQLTYIQLEDGEELECTISSLNWKKGLIEKIKIQDESGEKIKITHRASKKA